MNWKAQGFHKCKVVLLTYKGLSETTHNVRLGLVVTSGMGRMIIRDLKAKEFITFGNDRKAKREDSHAMYYIFKDVEELDNLTNGCYKFDMRNQKEHSEYYSQLKKYLYGNL